MNTEVEQRINEIKEIRFNAERDLKLDIAHAANQLIDGLISGADEDDIEKRALKLEEAIKADVSYRKTRFPTDEALPNYPSSGVVGKSEIDKVVRKNVMPKPEELSSLDLSIWGMICQTQDWAKHDNYAERLDSLYRQKFGASFRTMTSGASGTGQELLAEDVRAELFNDVVLGANVARLFEIVNMPTNPYDLPVMGDITFYKPAGEGQAVTATDLATAKRTLTAYTVKAQTDVSDELDQDSVIALIPQIRSRLVQNASREMDKLILLADTETGATGNINSDDAAPDSASDYLLGFDGIVKYALVTNSGQSSDLGALAIEDFGTLLALLDGKYIADPSRLAWISDPWTYVKAAQIADFRSVEKFGAEATIISGRLPFVYGVPFVVTDTMTKVDADGKYTTTDPSTNNTKGRIVLVHRDMWKVGVRQPVRVATERSEAKGVISVVVSFRLALVSFNADGKYTSIGYNITV